MKNNKSLLKRLMPLWILLGVLLLGLFVVSLILFGPVVIIYVFEGLAAIGLLTVIGIIAWRIGFVI